MARLCRYLPKLGLGVLVALVLLGLLPIADALGFLGPRTYLLVSQDPAELRPYGGYVGAYGAVQLLFGRVHDLDYGDTKDLDTPEAPPLFAASESPDFPTAARAMGISYAAAADVQPTAVIAVDPSAVSGLLELLGPLSVPGEPRPITSSNLLGVVLEHTQNFDDPEADRKEFVYDLGRALGERLRALPLTRWPGVVQALARAADERHVQIYASNPVLQQAVHGLGWDGAYPPPTNDFLAVVDDNVGYNKANLVTDEQLDYQVSLDATGASRATLTITYANRGTRQLGFDATAMPYLHDATYAGRVSVYVPAGSQRIGTGEPAQSAADVERGVFIQRVVVPPERQATLTLRYQLPDRTVDSRRLAYDLMVRKQAGTQGTPVRVSVTGPDGWRVLGGADRQWQAQALLTTDQRFGVVFEPPYAG